MVIDFLMPSDLDEVCKIENMSFSVPWSRDSLEKELSNESAVYLVARENNAVLGYIGVHNACGEGDITMIAVHPGHRKKGIGESLLKELLVQEENLGVEKIYLEVRESNIPAVSLYGKIGFIRDGLRKNYYTNPTENAVLMSKSIGGKE